MLHAETATSNDYKEIVSLIREARFPFAYEASEIERDIGSVENIKIVCGAEIVGWVGIHRLCGNAGTAHITVKKEWRKRWVSRALLRELGRVIFLDMKFNLLLSEQYSAEGTRLAHCLGFKMQPDGDNVLKLAHSDLQGKFRMNG